jgi:ABC-type amino acid transport substrate-binding protein
MFVVGSTAYAQPAVVSAQPTGCAVQPPPGASATKIKSWVDPRLCAWKTSFPHFAPPSTQDSSLSNAQSKGLSICAETDIRPIVYPDTKSGKIIGFEPDIMKAITSRLGITNFHYLNIPFPSYIPALQAHKCDVVMGGIAVTSQRADAPGIKYTYPYSRFADVVIVKGSSPYHTLADLRGKKIAVVTGSLEATTAATIAKKLGGGTSLQSYSSVAAPYLAVLSGTDAALIDLLATFKLHPNGNELRALPGLLAAPVDSGSPYYAGSGSIITSSSAGALNSAISLALASMIKDGTLAAILKKWNVYAPGITDFIRP